MLFLRPIDLARREALTAALCADDAALSAVLAQPAWPNPRAVAILEGLRARGRENNFVGIEMGLLCNPSEWIDRGIAWLRELEGEPLEGAILRISVCGEGIDWNLRAEEFGETSPVVAQAIGLYGHALHAPGRVRDLAAALGAEETAPFGVLAALREAYGDAADHGWGIEVR